MALKGPEQSLLVSQLLIIASLSWMFGIEGPVVFLQARKEGLLEGSLQDALLSTGCVH